MLKRIYTTFFLAIALMLISLSTYANNFDNVAVQLPKLKDTTWHKAFQKKSDVFGIMEFIPKTQTLSNWSQMVTIEFESYQASKKSTPMDKLMMRRLNNIKQACPQLHFKKLHENKQQLFYSWDVKNCGTGIKANQVEFVRIIKGVNGFNSVRYTIKTDKPSVVEHKQMLNTVMSAKLLK